MASETCDKNWGASSKTQSTSVDGMEIATNMKGMVQQREELGC